MREKNNDILDRLRETDYEPVCVEAIAEIKWLREQNAILQQAISEEGRANRMTNLYKKSLEEIEQLHTEINSLRLQLVSISIPKENFRG